MSIVDDNVVEDTEFINLALTSVDSAVILNPATARINVEDVDSELWRRHYYIPPSMHLHRKLSYSVYLCVQSFSYYP